MLVRKQSLLLIPNPVDSCHILRLPPLNTPGFRPASPCWLHSSFLPGEWTASSPWGCALGCPPSKGLRAQSWDYPLWAPPCALRRDHSHLGLQCPPAVPTLPLQFRFSGLSAGQVVSSPESSSEAGGNHGRRGESQRGQKMGGCWL